MRNDVTYIVTQKFTATKNGRLRATASYKMNVKSTVPREECWWGAHRPHLGLEPAGG